MDTSFEESIFTISSEEQFVSLAIEAFHHQYHNNDIYAQYVNHIKGTSDPQSLNDITFLPIEFYKNHDVVTGKFKSEFTFTSSSTTGKGISKHHVKDLKLYRKSFEAAFSNMYGPSQNFQILALLPAYLEREGSSLVYMADELIKRSKYRSSGFFLRNLNRLQQILIDSEKKEIRTLLLGVTFGLLEFAEKHPIKLHHTIIMETGGMKGRREELTRQEVHTILKNSFQVDQIHSEYGMTELMSQAYSTGKGEFETPPWMQVVIRDPSDPLTKLTKMKTGGINIIDLANIHSCCFVGTQDLGRQLSNNKFEILGRFDNSDIRGCNLMAL